MDAPNYFSILPANVRYDKSITDFQKILYSEVTALSNKFGFCIASNGYFANLYDKDELTISRAFSALKNAGHIRVDLSGAANNERKIYPIVGADPLTKISMPLDKNINGGIDKNVKDNNTSNNNKLNKDIVGKPDDAEKITPIVVGAIALLNELTKSAFKASSKKTRDTIKAHINEGATLEDFEKVIRHKVAAWLNDPKQSQYLRPETLFGPKFEGYLQCANRAAQINAIENLIDIELSEDQGSLYLDYYQYTRDHYPRLFATTRIIPASEYFALKPGGKRHRGLSLKWSPGDLKSIFKTTHDEAAKLVDTGKSCPALIELLNQKLSK